MLAYKGKKTHRNSKSGFTLLETLLSIALLLILSMIVYQGFMATLKLSANTGNYQQSSSKANSDAGLSLGNQAPAAVVVVPGTIKFTPPAGIGTAKDIPVNIYKVTPPTPVVLDAEDNSGISTTRRKVFLYNK